MSQSPDASGANESSGIPSGDALGTATSGGSSDPTPSRPRHPPIVPGPIGLRPAAPSGTWRVVVGVIGIVVGAFGGIFGFYSLMLPTFTSWTAYTPGSAGITITSPMTERAFLVVGAFGLVASIAMVLTASFLLARRRWARVSACWAAGAMIVFVIGYAVGVAIFQHGVMEAAMTQAAGRSAGPTPGAAQLGAVSWIVAAVTLVVTLILGLPAPLVIIAWLSRKSVREQVAAWPSAGVRQRGGA